MSTKKATATPKKSTRPTLAEIKGEAGKFCFVEIRDPHIMARAFTAQSALIGQRPLADVMIWQWSAVKIDLAWLDDPEFSDWYQSNLGVVVWRSDVKPEPRPTRIEDLPESLARSISSSHLQSALLFAMGEFDDKFMDFLSIEMHDVSNDVGVRWQRREYSPFLKTLKFLETKYQNRSEVIEAIDNQLRKIHSMKLLHEQLDEFDPVDIRNPDQVTIRRPYELFEQ